MKSVFIAGFIFLFLLSLDTLADKAGLTAQNELLFSQLMAVHQLTPDEIAQIKAIFAKSGMIGQGNPTITSHPVTVNACLAELKKQGIRYENPQFESICRDRYMAPLFDPARQKIHDAVACIDQFEFPNIPCAFPVVWVRTREAAEICGVMGKRLCDAHEWEGACDGALTIADYPFELAVGKVTEDAIRQFRRWHNRKYQSTGRWAYGPDYKTGICATSSRKSPNCMGGEWATCGSNTFPTGYFPDCRSILDVYDLHGNAAEHMNLPLSENQMSSRGEQYGYTEMKGSWFVFDQFRAHEDWCRWRAPYWHGSLVMDPGSHRNYHLGFRCCKSIGIKDRK